MKLTAESTVLDDKKIGDSFATLQVEADGIRTEVGTKVGNDEVISRINQTAESVKIQANRIQIDGVITAINDNTTTTIDGDKITTGTVTAEQIDATDIHVSSANIDGTLEASQIKVEDINIDAAQIGSGTINTARIPDLSANKITADTINIARIPATARNDTYITDIGSDGIRVHDSHTTNNSIVISSSGMDVVKGGDSVANFGTSMRIGKDGEQRVVVTSDTMAVYDVDGSNPFAVSTEGSLKTMECKWTNWVSGTSGATYYRSASIYLRGAVANNRFYVAVSTSGEPTTYTQYIDNPTTTTKTLSVSGVTFGISTVVGGGVLLTMTSTTSTKKYASFKWTESYRETTVKVNDQVLATRSQPATLVDSNGTSGAGTLYTYGNIAMLRLEVYKSNVSNNGAIYNGRLLHHLPVSPVNLIVRYSGICSGSIGTDGTVTLYNYTGATISPTSSSPIVLCTTYIFK